MHLKLNILCIAIGVVYKQLQFTRTMDIGYNKENLMYVPIPRLGDLQRNQQRGGYCKVVIKRFHPAGGIFIGHCFSRCVVGNE